MVFVAMLHRSGEMEEFVYVEYVKSPRGILETQISFTKCCRLVAVAIFQLVPLLMLASLIPMSLTFTSAPMPESRSAPSFSLPLSQSSIISLILASY